MAQSNKFRTAMSKALERGPKALISQGFRDDMMAFATIADDLATKVEGLSQPAATQSGGGSGSSSAASLKASAASNVSFGTVPKVIATASGGMNQNPNITPETALTVWGMTQAYIVDSHTDGYPSVRVAMVLAGENVKPGDALNVNNGVARLAHAGAGGYRCNAFAARGTGLLGEIIYTCGGTPVGRLADASPMSGEVLVLSTQPGRLTFDTAEVDKVFYQEVGFFQAWLPPSFGDTSPSMCQFAFFPFTPASTL